MGYYTLKHYTMFLCIENQGKYVYFLKNFSFLYGKNLQTPFSQLFEIYIILSSFVVTPLCNTAHQDFLFLSN
jgi:hypothetical protein